jgi:hypothetical protein
MYSDLVCSLAWCQSAFLSPSGPAPNRVGHVMDFKLDLLSGSFYVDRLGRIALGQFNTEPVMEKHSIAHVATFGGGGEESLDLGKVKQH